MVIAAHPGSRPEVFAEGALAVRHTGPASLHLLGAAAGPLGGDTITIDVTVTDGAELTLSTVAATLVYPGMHAKASELRWVIRVGTGARLRLLPEPTIVVSDATHTAHLQIEHAADAQVTVIERTQLGRLGENHPAARYAGALRIDCCDNGPRSPVLRHRLGLGATDRLDAGRALLSRYRSAAVLAEAPIGSSAAFTAARLGRNHAHGTVLPLAAGGDLTTVVGTTLARTAEALPLLRDRLG